MIIAALLAFGALLACWLFAAPEPPAAPDLPRVA